MCRFFWGGVESSPVLLRYISGPERFSGEARLYEWKKPKRLQRTPVSPFGSRYIPCTAIPFEFLNAIGTALSSSQDSDF